MCEITEFPRPYYPSLEAAVFDLDNANSDMEFWAEEFRKDPLYKHSADRFKAARDRYIAACDLAWEARYREVQRKLIEVGRA